MSALNSEILFIGGTAPDFQEFDFLEMRDLLQSRSAILEPSVRIAVLSMQNLKTAEVSSLLESISANSRSLRVILELKASQVQPADLIQWINHDNVDDVIEINHLPELKSALIKSLEKAGLDQQDEELQSLVEQQNKNLAQISLDLEERVLKRQRSLEQSKEKLLMTIRRDEALQKAIVGLQKALSVIEMERVLVESLAQDLSVSWVRVLFKSQSSLFESTVARALESFTILKLPLEKDSEELGSVFIAREKINDFSDSEREFLAQVSRAASLAMDRLIQMSHLERVQTEWQATFNSIRQPLALITQDYELVRQNESFLTESSNGTSPLRGQKCYQALFGRKTVCPGCQLGSSFQLDPSSTGVGNFRVYRVSSTSMKLENQNLFVNLYRDIGERLRLEKSILESAKTTELGLIGGSIAHELNNPMAGIMTFLQLIMMDLKGDEPYFSDVKEMQLASERSKEIIENLLNFARTDEMGASTTSDLKEILFRSLKIIEIKTKSMGVRIDSPQNLEPIVVNGSTNLIAQAIMNVLQAAIDRILIRKQDPTAQFSPAIHIGLFRTEDTIQLAFTDNGKGLGSTGIVSGLGLSVAQHILADFGGSLASYSVSATEHCVTIGLIAVPQAISENQLPSTL